MNSEQQSQQPIDNKVISGIAWASLERFGSLALQFIVNTVLANLLLPDEFGYIGVLSIFMAISQVLIDGGFATAIIQRQNPTRADYSTIFTWNLGLALTMYALLFATAPLIAAFFKLPLLTDIVRWFCFTLVLNALGQLQMVKMRKEMAFRFIAITTLTSYTVGGAAGIWMAVHGYGVWSLVAMSLINSGMTMLIYNLLSGWHPSLGISAASFRRLFGYGGYLLGATILQEAARNAQSIIIGRRFSQYQVGLYSQAYKLDQINSYAVPQVLVQVMFPFYSQIQDDSEKLRSVLASNVRAIAFLIFPVLTTLIIVADPLITWLWGDAWRPCVPYFQILCAGGLFTSLQNINFYAVAARGHSRVLFKWSIYKWSALGVLLLCGMWFGVEGLMWAMAISNANIFAVNALLVQRHVGYRFTAQIRSLIPIFITCLMAGATAIGAHRAWMAYVDAPYPGFAMTAVVAFGSYAAYALAMRLRAVSDIKNIYQKIRHKKC